MRFEAIENPEQCLLNNPKHAEQDMLEEEEVCRHIRWASRRGPPGRRASARTRSSQQQARRNALRELAQQRHVLAHSARQLTNRWVLINHVLCSDTSRATGTSRVRVARIFIYNQWQNPMYQNWYSRSEKDKKRSNSILYFLNKYKQTFISSSVKMLAVCLRFSCNDSISVFTLELASPKFKYWFCNKYVLVLKSLELILFALIRQLNQAFDNDWYGKEWTIYMHLDTIFFSFGFEFCMSKVIYKYYKNLQIFLIRNM